jgi:hypothetical protein
MMIQRAKPTSTRLSAQRRAYRSGTHSVGWTWVISEWKAAHPYHAKLFSPERSERLFFAQILVAAK